jgi:hypothetical protein
MTVLRSAPGSRGIFTVNSPRFSARALPILGAAAALALGPGSARAEKPDVLLLPYQALNKGVQPEMLEGTNVVVAQELGARGLNVTRADDVAESAAPAKPGKEAGRNAPTGDPGAGEKAQELIAKAKAAMEDSNVAPAIDQLKKAVKLLSDNGDAVPDLRALAEAYLPTRRCPRRCTSRPPASSRRRTTPRSSSGSITASATTSSSVPGPRSR